MILVTGAGGMIGGELVKLFSSTGGAVRAQTRAQFDFNSGDQSAYDELVRGCNSVVHCAGIVHRPAASNEDYAIANVRATRLLADAAARAAIDSFVFLSTSAVYGEGPFVDIQEQSPLRLDTPYGLSKANCEEALRRIDSIKRMIILRPSLVFGERDRGNMRSLITQIQRGLYFHIGGNTARKSLICAEDLALAVQLCLQQLPPGKHTFNVANPDSVSVVELADVIARAVGRPPLPVVPKALVGLGAGAAELLLGERAPLTPQKMRKMITSTTLSVEALVRGVAFQPKLSLEAAIRRQVAWLDNRLNRRFEP